MTLRLTWRRTWEDKAEDFVCHAPGVEDSVGRIYSDTKPGSVEKRWRWFLNGFLPERNVWLSGRGFALTKMEAAEALEAAYFAVIDKPA